MENQRNYANEAATVLGKECSKVLSDGLISATLLAKYQGIINETIEKYGYKGKNFKSIYLPVIIAMALERIDNEEVKVTSVNEILAGIETQKWN